MNCWRVGDENIGAYIRQQSGEHEQLLAVQERTRIGQKKLRCKNLPRFRVVFFIVLRVQELKMPSTEVVIIEEKSGGGGGGGRWVFAFIDR